MAEQDSAQDKTEEPTPKRLEQAREEGTIARSRELATAMVITLAIIALLLIGPILVNDIQEISAEAFSVSRGDIYDETYAVNQLWNMIQQSLGALMPFFLIMLIAAVTAPLALGGWIFTLKPLALKLDRLDPVKGLKRVFGVQGFVELAKALAKFALLSAAALTGIWLFFSQIMSLGAGTAIAAIIEAMKLILLSTFSLCVALFIVAAVDVPFQLWNHFRKLRMSRQELKDELKQTEGDPELRGKIKAIQREMSRRRMMQDVPNADVVLVNPTHYAVALKYDNKAGGAPKVLAKGTDNIAFKIREIAEHNDVHVYSEPALTRAIYFSTKIGQEIPRALYLAVAQVLAYIFQVDRSKKYGGPEPVKPQDLPVPDELLKPKPGQRVF